MTALVLPFSMSLTTDMQKAELEANRKKQAALIIQHWWRQVRHSRAARSRLDVIKRADAIEIDNIRMRAAEVFMMGAVKAQANVPSVNTIDIANRLIRAMLDERAAKAVEAVENKSIQTGDDGTIHLLSDGPVSDGAPAFDL